MIETTAPAGLVARPKEYTVIAVEYIEPAGILLPAAVDVSWVERGSFLGNSPIVPDWELAPFGAASPEADEAAKRLTQIAPEEWEKLMRRPGGRTALDDSPLGRGEYPVERLRWALGSIPARRSGTPVVTHADWPGLECLRRAFEVWLGERVEFDMFAHTGSLEVALRRGQRPRPGEGLEAFVRRVGADAEPPPELDECLKARGLADEFRRLRSRATTAKAVALLFESQLDDIYGDRLHVERFLDPFYKDEEDSQ